MLAVEIHKQSISAAFGSAWMNYSYSTARILSRPAVRLCETYRTCIHAAKPSTNKTATLPIAVLCLTLVSVGAEMKKICPLWEDYRNPIKTESMQPTAQQHKRPAFQFQLKKAHIKFFLLILQALGFCIHAVSYSFIFCVTVPMDYTRLCKTREQYKHVSFLKTRPKRPRPTASESSWYYYSQAFKDKTERRESWSHSVILFSSVYYAHCFYSLLIYLVFINGTSITYPHHHQYCLLSGWLFICFAVTLLLFCQRHYKI